MRLVLIAIIGFVVALLAPEAVQAAPAGCSGAQYRSFDFMIGTWVGRNAKGEIRGKAEVTSVLAGCSIRMHWTGRTFEGTNNNTYDATRGVCQKAWFDNTGGVELSTGTASPGTSSCRRRTAIQASRSSASGGERSRPGLCFFRKYAV